MAHKTTMKYLRNEIIFAEPSKIFNIVLFDKIFQMLVSVFSSNIVPKYLGSGRIETTSIT